MIFDNVNILGYQHENNFFGEKSINFSSKKTLSIRGYILDLANFNGVKNIFDGATALQNIAENFQQVIINGENFGVGKIKSLNIDPGNWVRTTEYQADIEILTEAPLQNLDSDEFQGSNSVNLNDKKLNLLKSFSENFSVEFDTQNKVLNGSHEIDIEYDADNQNINLISLAQSLATELLKTIPTNLSESNYLTRTNYKVLNTENYSLVDGKCGFRRTFSYNNNSDTINRNYSINRTHSITLNEDGVSTVVESCEIKGVNPFPSLYASAMSGLRLELEGVSFRINSFFAQYKSKFGITVDLNNKAVDRNIRVNKFSGTITYDIAYDNDEKKQYANYTWEKTQTLDRNSEGIWSASEEGTIVGEGKQGEINRYEYAEAAWGALKDQILARVYSFYSMEAKNQSGAALREISKSIKREKYNGSINYTFNYSDDPSIQDGLNNGIKRIIVEKNDTGIQPIIKNFIIPNQRYAMAQNRNFKKQGQYKVSVTMEIGCINSQFIGALYINECKQRAGFSTRGSEFAPFDPRDFYLESVSFSSDEIEQTVTYEAVYNYS
jgi:hypothetical protein